MKSDLINRGNSDISEPYTHKLIYIDYEKYNHVEALGIFRLDGESIEAAEAETFARERLANILFYGVPKTTSSIEILKRSFDPDFVKISASVSTRNVRLSSTLNTLDAEEEGVFSWDSTNKLNAPYLGGVGVIPPQFKYACYNKRVAPVPYRLYPTTEDVFND